MEFLSDILHYLQVINWIKLPSLISYLERENQNTNNIKSCKTKAHAWKCLNLQNVLAVNWLIILAIIDFFLWMICFESQYMKWFWMYLYITLTLFFFICREIKTVCIINKCNFFPFPFLLLKVESWKLNEICWEGSKQLVIY